MSLLPSIKLRINTKNKPSPIKPNVKVARKLIPIISVLKPEASGFKTLIIGISFLATFTFGFIGLGLFLVFIRSLIEGNKDKTD